MGKINRRTFAKTSLTLASLMALDPVEMIRECFKKLGPSVKSCHAKDIILSEEIYTPHLTEVNARKGKPELPGFPPGTFKF